MIKETVDAVRVAEMEAEKVVATAKENAEGEKVQIKIREVDYRAEQMQVARSQAKNAMDKVVKQCNQYDLEKNKEIEEKVAKLKASSEEKMDAAVNVVIDALV